MTSPFDYVKAFNSKKEIEFEEKTYLPFIVNRALSFQRDTVLLANEMNMYSGLPTKAQFDFYMKGVPKGNRYGKWEKMAETTEVVEMLKVRYNINNQVATKYASLLSDSDVQQLRESNEKGGKNGSRN